MQIKSLTSDEIQSLQYDAAARLLLEHSNLLIILNDQLQEANRERLQAQIKVDQCKNSMRVIKQNMTAFQTICRSA